MPDVHEHIRVPAHRLAAHAYELDDLAIARGAVVQRLDLHGSEAELA